MIKFSQATVTFRLRPELKKNLKDQEKMTIIVLSLLQVDCSKLDNAISLDLSENQNSQTQWACVFLDVIQKTYYQAGVAMFFTLVWIV